jgi:hypothetical protein
MNLNPASSAYYDLTDWTDDQITFLLEGSGAVKMVVIGIHGYNIDPDDCRWKDWKTPKHEGIRRAVANAYLYGIYTSNLSCEKWHKHCRENINGT